MNSSVVMRYIYSTDLNFDSRYEATYEIRTGFDSFQNVVLDVLVLH